MQNINIEITGEHLSIENDIYIYQLYGSIYNKGTIDKLLQCSSKIEVISVISDFSGYFFLIVKNKSTDNIFILNDIFGNFRVYIYETEKNIFISDNYASIFNKLELPAINKDEEMYYKRHRYTTGFNGIHKSIRKLPPASLLTLGIELKWELYFKKEYFNRSLNESLNNYPKQNYNLIRNNIADNINRDKKTFLFFSGGVDSTYLALLLQDIGVDFEAVFIKYLPSDKDNIVDENKVITVIKKLDIALKTIELNIKNTFDVYQDIALQSHPIDKAFSISLYYACDILKREYGSCNIINGQSSDSIYCWGSSSKTIGAFLQRYLTLPFYIKSNSLIKKISSLSIKSLYKKRWEVPFNFEIPTNYHDYLIGVLDPQGYLPIKILDVEYKEYNDYLETIIKYIDDELDNDLEYIIFYMKFLYLQGTSNIPVIKAAEIYEHNIIIPFLDARIVKLKIEEQNELKNLFFPRYVLEEWMESYFKFDLRLIDEAKSFNTKVKQDEIKEFDNLVKVIYNRWDFKFEKIFG